MDIYADATCKPYGYLFLDNQPSTHPLLRIRAKVTRDYQLVYTLLTKKNAIKKTIHSLSIKVQAEPVIGHA